MSELLSKLWYSVRRFVPHKRKRKLQDLIDDHIGRLRCAGAVFDREREIEYVRRKYIAAMEAQQADDTEQPA